MTKECIQKILAHEDLKLELLRFKDHSLSKKFLSDERRVSFSHNFEYNITALLREKKSKLYLEITMERFALRGIIR